MFSKMLFSRVIKTQDCVFLGKSNLEFFFYTLGSGNYQDILEQLQQQRFTLQR